MIDIIIPTMYGEGCMLRECLESIRKYTTPPKKFGDIRITVVYNDSKLSIASNGFMDKSTEVLRLGQEIFKDSGFMFAKLNSQSGYANAINQGLEWTAPKDIFSTEHYYILLNDDCILLEQPANKWLDDLTTIAEQKVGIVGVKWLYEVGYKFTPFFCVLITGDLINAIGLLDTRFEVGSMEDVDYCIRAERAGFKVMVQDPDEIGSYPIWHKGENTVNKIENWVEFFHANQEKLKDKYKNTDISNSEENPCKNQS